MTSRISDVEEGYGAVTEVQRPEGSKLGRFVRLAAVLAVAAVVVVALAGVSSTGQPDQSAATWEYADKRNMALLLQKAKMGTTKLQEEAPAEEEAPCLPFDKDFLCFGLISGARPGWIFDKICRL